MEIKIVNQDLRKGKRLISVNIPVTARRQVRLFSIWPMNSYLQIIYKPFRNPKYLAYKLLKGYNTTIGKLKLWFRDDILRKPIYYSYWSRDCDMCESSGYDQTSGSKNWNKIVADFYRYACEEGPGSIHRVSEEEFLTNGGEGRHVRDRVMEAYENGNGTSIWV